MWIIFTLLAASLWALVNVIDSMIVRHHERRPIVVIWYASLWRVVLLAILFLLTDVQTQLAVPLFFFGLISYFGALMYIDVLDRIDVSVTQAAWAIQAIYLSFAGFLVFQESWTFLQTVGSVLLLGAVLLLAYWHKHVSILRTLLLLALMGLFLAPEEVMKKFALLKGEDLLPVFFWSYLGHSALGFIVPLFSTKTRANIFSFLQRTQFAIHSLFAVDVVFSMVAFFAIVLAYTYGPLSLVSVMSSSQPFLVMIFAWFAVRLIPHFAPRELLTMQSIGVKIVGFSLASIGLVFLARGG